MRDLEGGDSSGDEELLLGIDADEADSCDEMPTGHYSRLDGERNVEPLPILTTANHVKESVQRESSASKASSSQEQAAKKDEDAGVEFHQNLVFMRKTLPDEAVPQPTPL